MKRPNITMYINNNPKCSVSIESTAKGEVWNMTNTPYILIKGTNIENGIHKLIIKSSEVIFFNGEVEVKENNFEHKVELTNPIVDPKVMYVTLNSKTYEIPTQLATVYGKAAFKDNNPVVNPVLHLPHRDITAIGDEKGNFKISVCGIEASLAILDKSYSKNTLEAWFFNIDIEDNLELNLTIDKMEVYRIHMWAGEISDYIHFIPMSLKRIQHALSMPFTSQLEMLDYKDMWPTLSKENVQVFANKEQIKILTFQEVQDVTAEIEDKIYSRPSYVISIPKGYKNNLIKICIASTFELNNITYQEKGEGYYCWQ